jgi:hypothetical protein
MADKTFIKGLIYKLPHANAPEFVKGKLSIKSEELIGFIKEQNSEWINIDLKISKDNKPYAELDTWKPDSNRTATPPPQEDNADLPWD